MSGNTFGHLLRLTTFGESHGPLIGAVLDGVPPRLPLDESDIQPFLDRRRPGQSRFTTQRQETDRVRIVSGVFEGQTTGTPIGLLIENADARSKDYGAIKDVFRPGHADYTYWCKYGIRDYRGGGRSSARRRRCGSQPVPSPARSWAMLSSSAAHWSRWEPTVSSGRAGTGRNACAIRSGARMPPRPLGGLLDGIRKNGSSTGGIVEIEAAAPPAGLGAPIFDRLDADLAKALMSIPAVKGVEIGAGFAAAARTGAENNDEMRMDDGSVRFLSNHAGGILGGISTGQPIICRIAVKPTSSLPIPQRTVNTAGEDAMIATKGRHDPCVAIRAVPVAEAMVALVLADHLLRHKAQCR